MRLAIPLHVTLYEKNLNVNYLQPCTAVSAWVPFGMFVNKAWTIPQTLQN